MNQNRQSYLASIIPFLVLGVLIALAVGMFIFLSYVLLWGLFIGIFLWCIAWIKNFFFPKKTKENASGRIIEHHNDHDNK